MRTETVAPNTSALCHPKDIFWDLGLAAIQMANKEMRKEAKSVRPPSSTAPTEPSGW